MYRHAPILATAATTLVLTMLLAAIGVEPWFVGPASVLRTLLTSGLLALAWLLAAWGIGAMGIHLVIPTPEAASEESATKTRLTLALPLGVALMLFLSHALGTLGLFRVDAIGAIAAWTPIAVGLACLVLHTRRATNHRSHQTRPTRRSTSWIVLAAAPPIATLLLAACCPPGTLWTSEARGFDVLSYHLQLPREWLAAGRLAPLEHNAYSWLPSYMEAAYLHLGAMASFLTPDPFTDGEGIATAAASLQHALLAIAAAFAVSSLASALTARCERADAGDPRFAAALASLFFLSVPWVIVTGSLAYNEMPVCLMLAAALLVIDAPGLSPARRGALIGVLVGAACGAKPTALFMVGAPVGVLMLWRTPRRQWLPLIAAGAATGLAMLAPYLARNWIAAGNPVFPYLTSIFGDAHWTNLEVARWRLGHHGGEPWLERARLLTTNRGYWHIHFLLLSPFATLLVVIGPINRRLRGITKEAAVLIVLQVAIWGVIGHQQSRFLLPTLVAVASAFPLAWLVSKQRPVRWAREFTALLIIAQTGIALKNVAQEFSTYPARPGVFASGGVGLLTGEGLEAIAPSDPEANRRWRDSLAPHQWINLAHSNDIRRLYLLGDSTPYCFRVPVLSHTTWDPSPLGGLLRATPGDWDAVIHRLAAPAPDGLGVSHVLVNFDELHRLHRDGWYDPDATADAAAELIRRSTIIESWSIPGSAGRVLIKLNP